MFFCSLVNRFISAWLYAGSRNRRVLVFDVILLTCAVFLGYALRLTFFVNMGYWREMEKVALFYVTTLVTVMYIGKIYCIAWPQASVEEYARLFRCYCSGAFVFMLELFFLNWLKIPRSSLVIMLFAGIFFLVFVRASWRLAAVTRFRDKLGFKRALIIGAGEAGTMLARDLVRNKSNLQPIGFIDENPQLTSMLVASLTVLGRGKDLPVILLREKIDTVLIALPSATGTQIRSYLDMLSPYNVTVRVLPSLIDLADGQVNIGQLRSVSLEDLLRREPVTLDNFGIENLVRDKIVLVTGAGGSIGSEICRQILSKKPKQLLALGHGEMSIYSLMESLIQAGNKIPVKPLIADVADTAMMENIYREYRPQLVFHAGAHKHVPLMEENPQEALRVNSFGTWNIASLAGKFGVERMVMISTDKAVNPTSVMGATKRIAEKLIFYVQKEYPDTKYMAVRFGNVLGSRGSVVPKFEKQIEAGGPVTVSDKNMKRYFMLIPEAVSLVLQAGTMGLGGELFVLDMGDPVNITEMAETLIRLHGYKPYKDIKIEFTGIRQGEKLYEELFYDAKNVDKTAHEKIFKSRFALDSEDVFSEVKALLEAHNSERTSLSELKDAIFTLCAQKG